MRVGIRAQEEKSGVTQEVSYLSYPGLSTKGVFRGGDDLIPWQVIWLVAVSYNWQYVYSRWMSFEIDALRLKSLMSGTYPTVSKEVIREEHRLTCKNI